ncbi:hypothetical protein OR1_00858 [Geobacter sp. OR-1]|nr:hypothetical protein OR1_00858 [Geobacter sp. OR-1]
MHQPKSKKGGLAGRLSIYFKFFFILAIDSITFSRWPKADS